MKVKDIIKDDKFNEFLGYEIEAYNLSLIHIYITAGTTIIIPAHEVAHFKPSKSFTINK